MMLKMKLKRFITTCPTEMYINMIPLEYFLNFNINNKQDFIKRFIFNPLFEAYNHLKLIEEIKNSNEVKINREMYKYIRDFSSISREIQKHIIFVNYKPKEVVGDGEHEPDLQFVLPNCFSIFFEAKRIYKSDSYSIYCGEGGLGRFLSGYYSSEDIDGGMIAYVQIGNILEAQEKIIRIVQKMECINVNRNIGIDSTLLSIHKRLSNNNIKIYHIFFDLT